MTRQPLLALVRACWQVKIRGLLLVRSRKELQTSFKRSPCRVTTRPQQPSIELGLPLLVVVPTVAQPGPILT